MVTTSTLVAHDWYASLMLRSDASLEKDLRETLRESPTNRKLKFLNGSSRQVTGRRARLCSMNMKLLPFFTGFISFLSNGLTKIRRIVHRSLLSIGIRFPVELSAICIRDDSWRYRWLRARFRSISSGETRTLTGMKAEKVKMRFNGYICAVHLWEHYTFESSARI